METLHYDNEPSLTLAPLPTTTAPAPLPSAPQPLLLMDLPLLSAQVANAAATRQEAFTGVVRTLQAQTQRRRKQNNRLALSLTVLLTISYTAFYVSMLMADINPLLVSAIAIGSTLSSVLALGMIWKHKRRANGDIEQSLTQLAQLANYSCLGALVEALEVDTGVVRRGAAHILQNLLLGLKASDAAYFTREQRAYLCDLLVPARLNAIPMPYRRDVALAILKAFEQIGDIEALPHIERVVRTNSDPIVRNAAQMCLPFLQSQLNQAKANAMLLRASQETETASDALLRPASAVDSSQPELLLRPHDPQEPAPQELE